MLPHLYVYIDVLNELRDKTGLTGNGNLNPNACEQELNSANLDEPEKGFSPLKLQKVTHNRNPDLSPSAQSKQISSLRLQIYRNSKSAFL